MKFIWVALLTFSSGAVDSFGQALATPDLLRELQTHLQRTNYTEALAIANQLISGQPGNAQGYLVRGQVYDAQREFGKAIADYNHALSLDPRGMQIYQQRGLARFKMGQIAEAIVDFDKAIQLKPAQAAYHWQRGIALFEVGRFDDGRKQFEAHKKVNPDDVENAAWHFLCVAKSASFAKAREDLLPVKNDPRVPMDEIYALYQGKGTIYAVFEAVRKNATSSAATFYANLYVGLFVEARGDDKGALEYVKRSLERSLGMDYMGDVARIHGEELTKRIAAKSNLKK
jgi:lipoprotein NlpI